MASSRRPVAVTAEVERYLACDLVFYRAPGPAGLVARQSAAWDPVLAWARDALGARFVLARGNRLRRTAPAGACRRRRRHSARAVAARRGAFGHHAHGLGVDRAWRSRQASLSVDAAWAAAHVDEDWNMDFWGRDEPALERRASRFAEMQAAATVLQRLT